MIEFIMFVAASYFYCLWVYFMFKGYVRTPKVGEIWKYTEPQENPFLTKNEETRLVLEIRENWIEYRTENSPYSYLKIEEFMVNSKKVN